MTIAEQMLERAKEASYTMCDIDDEQINRVLLAVADRLVETTDTIVAENRKDLERMEVSDPKYDRLRLTRDRIAGMASDMRGVASLPSPVGKTLSSTVRPNGMRIDKVTVPFGVVGVIYEARPNVTSDVFSLCLKSGNVAVLKGGSDAEYSNIAIAELIQNELESNGLKREICTLLPAQREATATLLHAEGVVDLIIPRGSSSLIKYVRQQATVPVIETGAGVCHAYFDESGDTAKGKAIVNNAKTRRVSVCNALDCLIVNSKRLGDLGEICSLLSNSNVIIYADEEAYDALKGKYPDTLLQHADEHSFGHEFIDYKMSIKTVDDIYGALNHIAHYGSHHSESIITEDTKAAQLFTRRVDAACVYSNLPTSFTDGAQFGFGAEIGISTQKLHARGPMALPELTTYKYIITGDGQIRSK